MCAREYILKARFGTLKEQNMILNNKKIKSILIGCLLGSADIEIVDGDKAFITYHQKEKYEDHFEDLHGKLKEGGIRFLDIKYTRTHIYL
jgi:hypothetical protein